MFLPRFHEAPPFLFGNYPDLLPDREFSIRRLPRPPRRCEAWNRNGDIDMLQHTFSAMRAMRFVTVAGLIGLPGALQPAAYALQCGDVITQDTVLTEDLGPCSGNGLVVGQPGVTLNLNGHSITGTGTAIGIWLRFPNPNGPATVQGPGVVAGFGFGVAFSMINNVTIRDVRFLDNVVQISFAHSNTVLIANNELIGRGSAETAIQVSSSSLVTIQENKISGHSKAGIAGSNAAAISVLNNVIRRNGVGISPGIEPGYWTIRENIVSANQGDGIVVGSCSEVADNQVTRNGGTGILTQGPAAGCPIQDNTVKRNAMYGIAVVRGYSFRVIGNHASHNGVDLFWDGTGGPNCWSDNSFKTSEPSVLPACQ